MESLSVYLCVTSFSVFSHETFIFAVGPDLKEFTIHKEAFRPLAPYFKTLMDGGMQEAQNGRAAWDDIKVESFGRLCHFAYTNDYKTPAIPNPQPESKEFPYWEKPALEKLSKAPNLWFWKQVALLLYDAESETRISMPLTLELCDEHYKRRPRSPITIKPPLEVNTNSYVDNLSCNAEMYVLADRYGIKKLKPLALYKLGESLLAMKFSHIKELSSIVQYAVQNTRTQDDMRRLLAQYVAAITRRRFPEIDTLIDDFPEFAVEVFHLFKATL